MEHKKTLEEAVEDIIVKALEEAMDSYEADNAALDKDVNEHQDDEAEAVQIANELLEDMLMELDYMIGLASLMARISKDLAGHCKERLDEIKDISWEE